MSSKLGRPTESPKNFSTRIRMSKEDIEKLEYCCKATGKLKAEIIREGINKVYNQLKK